jgi:5'-deoxynucleotidase YfbR-like HD superfamily hydrolase
MSDDLVKRLLDWPSVYARQAADRIDELEAQLKTVLDRETAAIARYDAKMEAAEDKLAKVKDALSAFKVFEDSAFRGVDHEKIKRAAYRGVKRKLLAALKMLEVE